MERKFTKIEISKIKKDFTELLATKQISINNSADLDALEGEKLNSFFEILNQYSSSNNISEEDLIAILVDEYVPIDYYKPYKKNAIKESSYYRTLDKNAFKDEFKANFASKVQEAFKEELTKLESQYKNVGDIYKLPNFWAESGALVDPGSIKGLVNSKASEVKKTNAAELRVSGYGTSRAKPTIYINLNIQDNYIFLGTCHKKDNGEKGEEAYIARSISQYQRFLAFKAITEENIVDVEKDL